MAKPAVSRINLFGVLGFGRTCHARCKTSIASNQSFVIYGANTDVGKTLVSAGLCRVAIDANRPVSYIKPVQTGLDKDATAIRQHCGDPSQDRLAVTTLFHYASPESPASAAKKEGGGVTDCELQLSLTQALLGSSASTNLIETAGGPLSPAPSGTPQADVYAHLGLPCILVGDPRLGGISATLCALEALANRRQDVSAVLFLGADGIDGNAAGLQEALEKLGRNTKVFSIPPPPPFPEPVRDWLQKPSVARQLEEVYKAIGSQCAGKQNPVSTKMSSEEYAAFDRDHMWHPYTSMANPNPAWAVRRAFGCEIELENGQRLTDGMSSWWCAIHGYNVPELNAAASRQLSKMSHVMFGGLTHRPAAELGALLVGCTPAGLERVFLCDSGSVSVEVAFKMVTQYWVMRGRPEKCRIATVRRGYHGDTFGAMAACDPDKGMHSMFRGMLSKFLFADAPRLAPSKPEEACRLGEISDGFESMKELLTAHAHEVSAVILEPIVQGAGGMRIYSPSYLIKLRKLCDELGILVIFDEIATGFGRTGRLFAAEHADVVPDIMCVGKALTGGYCTLAAVVTTDDVALGVSGNGSQPLMHGPTYMANPLACAIGVASLELLLSSHWQQRVSDIEKQLHRELEPLRDHPDVVDVRILGAIGAVELRKAPADPRAFQAKLVDLGVWIRPFGELLYIMPPFVISSAELSKLTAAMVAVVTQTYRA